MSEGRTEVTASVKACFTVERRLLLLVSITVCDVRDRNVREKKMFQVVFAAHGRLSRLSKVKSELHFHETVCEALASDGPTHLENRVQTLSCAL